MLELYKGYFHEIIIFSPTLLNDDKWDYVRNGVTNLLAGKEVTTQRRE